MSKEEIYQRIVEDAIMSNIDNILSFAVQYLDKDKLLHFMDFAVSNDKLPQFIFLYDIFIKKTISNAVHSGTSKTFIEVLEKFNLDVDRIKYAISVAEDEAAADKADDENLDPHGFWAEHNS